MTVATQRKLAAAHPGRGYCHLVVFNADDLGDNGAKTALCFGDISRLNVHNHTGLEQQALCAKIAAAMALLEVIERAPESSEPLTDAEIVPWAREIIRAARSVKIL